MKSLREVLYDELGDPEIGKHNREHWDCPFCKESNCLVIMPANEKFRKEKVYCWACKTAEDTIAVVRHLHPGWGHQKVLSSLGGSRETRRKKPSTGPMVITPKGLVPLHKHIQNMFRA